MEQRGFFFIVNELAQNLKERAYDLISQLQRVQFGNEARHSFKDLFLQILIWRKVQNVYIDCHYLFEVLEADIVGKLQQSADQFDA